MMAMNAPATNADWPDVTSKIVNGLVVIVVALLVILVFSQLINFGGLKADLLKMLADPKQADAARVALQSMQTNDGTLFGALTTFLGTAIGAYFGISVSASASRTAINASAQQNADANQKLGAAQQQIDTARLLAQNLNPAQPGHLDQISALRTTLQ